MFSASFTFPAAAGSAAWTPAATPGFAWYDASDDANVTLDGSNNISQINDKFGNGRHAAQSTAGARPGRSVWRNGLSAANLDNVDDCLVTSSFTATPVGPMLVAWAGDWDEITSDSMLLSLNATNDFTIDFFTTGFLPYMGGMGLDSYWQLGGANIQLDHYADFITSTSSASDTRLRWNGSEKTKNSGTHIQSVQNVTQIGLGYSIASAANFFGGNLGELIIWTGAAANETTAALAREYLRAKWGF